MEKFIIEGGHPLKGEVTPSGNKNAALPILAACLLSEEPIILNNIPLIQDVLTMKKLLKSVGMKITELEPHKWELQADNLCPGEMDPDITKKIRASILLAGPLVGRGCDVTLPPPGGDVIGRRRLDSHILAMQKLGADFSYDRNFHFKAKVLKGTDILLDEVSVTGTENAIMASVLAKGKTTLRNAASEPHVQQLCHLLNSMGAKISNIGSNVLEITGVEQLHGAELNIGSDYLEVLSFVGAAVMTNGEITIRKADNQYLDMIRLVFERLGVRWEVRGEDIFVPKDQEMVIESDLGDAIPAIKVMPWPAFPTDLMSIALVVATQSKGTILFHDWMYPSRMFFTDKLVGMGAQIVLCDPHRCIVNGPTKLYAEKMESPDIRAGMALLLAALSAEGTSRISNIGQIERGYERVDEKLKALGAHIERVNE